MSALLNKSRRFGDAAKATMPPTRGRAMSGRVWQVLALLAVAWSTYRLWRVERKMARLLRDRKGKG